MSVGKLLEGGALVGPLIDAAAFTAMQAALDEARSAGGVVHGGARVTDGVPAGGVYVRPALVEMPAQAGPVLKETFAPILYVLTYSRFDEALGARRRPAAVANPARTPGRPTCGGRPAPSITATRCRWPRASRSRSASDTLADIAGVGR